MSIYKLISIELGTRSMASILESAFKYNSIWNDFIQKASFSQRVNKTQKKKPILFLENKTNSDNLANASNETNKRNCIRSVQARKMNSSFWQSNFKTDTCKLWMLNLNSNEKSFNQLTSETSETIFTSSSSILLSYMLLFLRIC